MKFLTFLSFVPVFMSCSDLPQQITDKGKLSLKEVSGLEYIPSSGLWAVEDSGNENTLYNIDENGKILSAYTVKNAKNTDWEDLASDAEGNIYIGDFGNNNNKRQDLAIYKVSAGRYDSVVAKTEFYYPEQKAFPPKKSEWIYDAESFFESNGTFYIFTKNRSKGFDGSFNVYTIPNKPGRHAARLVTTLQSCGNYRKCAITGADISPDGTRVVLLSGDKIWLLTGFGNGDFTKVAMQQLALGHFSQKEGITFKDNDTILIADERDKGEGGKLYEVKLSDLKSKI
jgi:hypothetical protein